MEVWVHPRIELHLPAHRVGPHVGVTHTRVPQAGAGAWLPFAAGTGMALGCTALLVAIAVWFRLRSVHRSRSRAEVGDPERRPEIRLELVPVPELMAPEPVVPEPVVPEPGIAIVDQAPFQPGETVHPVGSGGRGDDVGAELRLVSAEVSEIHARAQQVGSNHDEAWVTSWDEYRNTVESAVAEIRRLREWLARTRSERLMIAGELELDRRREIVNRAWGRGIFTRKHERARLIRRAFGAERQAELAQREINTRESIQDAIRTLLRETRRVERQLIRREVRAEIESARADSGTGLLWPIPDAHTNTIDFASAHASMERSDTGWNRANHV